jgi:hypothetical protein
MNGDEQKLSDLIKSAKGFLNDLSRKPRSVVNDYQRDVFAVAHSTASKRRLHDPVRGGILWTEGRTYDQPALVGCRSKTEVTLTRAIFNSRPLRVATKTTKTPQKLILVSYEANLLRIVGGTSGDRARVVSCDLVGTIGGRKLVPIEVKCRPNDDTNLDHALLEGLAYGLVLAEAVKSRVHREKKELEEHLLIARHRFGAQGSGQLVKPSQVEFAVAAPAYYYKKQLSVSNKDVARRAAAIQDSLARRKCGFYGYIVLRGALDDSQSIRTPMASSSLAIPVLTSSDCVLCTTLDELRESVEV